MRDAARIFTTAGTRVPVVQTHSDLYGETSRSLARVDALRLVGGSVVWTQGGAEHDASLMA